MDFYKNHKKTIQKQRTISNNNQLEIGQEIKEAIENNSQTGLAAKDNFDDLSISFSRLKNRIIDFLSEERNISDEVSAKKYLCPDQVFEQKHANPLYSQIENLGEHTSHLYKNHADEINYEEMENIGRSCENKLKALDKKSMISLISLNTNSAIKKLQN